MLPISLLSVFVTFNVNPCEGGRCQCSTQLTASDVPTLMALQQSGAYDLFPPLSVGVNQILVKAHIVRSSNGSGGLSLSRLNQSIADLNSSFSGTPMQFTLINEVDYIDNDNFTFIAYGDDAKEAQLREINPTPNAIDIYFVPELEDLCGTSWFSSWPGTPGIIMDNDCSGVPLYASVIGHEVGHYFDLLHTHETAVGQECVDGSNCNFAGDLVCDTPADPELIIASNDPNDVNANWYPDCSFTGAPNDPTPCGGSSWNPLTDNIMSYHHPQCSTEFTPDQVARMYSTLVNFREELLQNGACCFESGTCTLIDQLTCGNAGGVFQGDGSSCQPNSCPQPPALGACCLPDLSCAEVEASECVTLGGDYKGDDSECASFNCAAGACCFGLDACSLAIESQCDAAGGDFRGPGSDCDTEDCTLPVGACCIGGVCIPEFDPSLCVSSGGEFQGVGSDCAADPCAVLPATGACCFSDGSCFEETEIDCEVNGGIYSGDNTPCVPNPCPQPPATGACCAPDGSCSEQTEADCEGVGGVYSGDGTPCTPNPCSQPPATGACCSEDGSCAVLTQTSCAASGGIYQGDDTGCEAVVCSDDVVITVDDDFGENPQANFDSIQDAINAASDGATILVYPGTYTGNLDFVLDFGSKSVAVQSTSGASQTSIDAQWSRGLVNFNGTTEGVASLIGFTLKNCDLDAVPPVAFNTPSAINILNGASVEIADCVLQDLTNGVGGASGENSLVLHVGSEEGFGCGQISVENCSFSGVSLEEGHFAGIGNCDVSFVSCLFSGIQVLETTNSASMFDIYQASIEILDSEIVNCVSSSRFFDTGGICEIRDSKILGCFALDWDASSTSIGSSELCDNTPPIDGFINLGGNFDCSDEVVITVDDDLLDAPDADFTSIQQAVDAAFDDVIMVYPGTYTNFEWVGLNKSVTVRSVLGSDVTFIDAEENRSFVLFSGNSASEIDGFSFIRGNLNAAPLFGDTNIPPALILFNTENSEYQPVLRNSKILSASNPLGNSPGNPLESSRSSIVVFERSRGLLVDTDFTDCELEVGHFLWSAYEDVNIVGCNFYRLSSDLGGSESSGGVIRTYQSNMMFDSCEFAMCSAPAFLRDGVLRRWLLTPEFNFGSKCHD